MDMEAKQSDNPQPANVRAFQLGYENANADCKMVLALPKVKIVNKYCGSD